MDVIEKDEDFVRNASISPVKNRVALWNKKSVYVYDMETAQPIFTSHCTGPQTIREVFLSNSGNKLFFICGISYYVPNPKINIVDLSTQPESMHSVTLKTTVQKFKVSQDEETAVFFSGEFQGIFTFVDLKTYQISKTLKLSPHDFKTDNLFQADYQFFEHRYGVVFDISNSGERLAVAYPGGSINIYDAHTGVKLAGSYISSLPQQSLSTHFEELIFAPGAKSLYAISSEGYLAPLQGLFKVNILDN